MMVISIGLSSYSIAIFHLINHAFYKGLLFLGAGAVIHAVKDNQDLRRYGGLITFLPLSYTVILIASLSLVAFPFMTGFYSKDFILESAYGKSCFSSIDVYYIAVIGAIFTTLYSVKVIYLTFLANPNGSVNSYKNVHEGDVFLSLPLVMLAIFSIYFGYLTRDILIGLGSEFFKDNSIYLHPIGEISINTEFSVTILFKLLPLIFTASFITLATVYPEFITSNIFSFKFFNLVCRAFGFFSQRCLVEFFYNKFIVKRVIDIGGQTTKILDKGSVECVGPYGIRVILTKISKKISGLSKGVVTDYALYILLSVCIYLSILTFLWMYFEFVNSIIMSFVVLLMGISCYMESNKKISKFNKFELNLMSSVLLPWRDVKLIFNKLIIYLAIMLFRIIKFLIKKILRLFFKPSVILGIILNLIFGGGCAINLDETDDEETSDEKKREEIKEGKKKVEEPVCTKNEEEVPDPPEEEIDDDEPRNKLNDWLTKEIAKAKAEEERTRLLLPEGSSSFLEILESNLELTMQKIYEKFTSTVDDFREDIGEDSKDNKKPEEKDNTEQGESSNKRPSTEEIRDQGDKKRKLEDNTEKNK